MDACFADQALADRILKIRLDAQKQHEISSTPSFVIDGKSYPGSATSRSSPADRAAARLILTRAPRPARPGARPDHIIW